MNLLDAAGSMVTTITLALALCQGSMLVNVQDHGAKPDGSTDSTVFIERAYKDLRSKIDINRGIRGTLFFPSSQKEYLVSRPIVIEDPYITVKGDNGGSKILNVGFGPIFVIGLRTKEWTGSRIASLDPRFYPNRSALGMPGNGIRLNGEASIGFYGTPFDLGPPTDVGGGLSRWGGQTAFTAELLYQSHETEWRQHGIFSIGGYHNPSLLKLTTSGVRNRLDFFIADDAGKLHSASFDITPGLNRIRIRVDFINDTIDMLSNGVLTTKSIDSSGRMGYNPHEPFLIGTDVNTSDGRITMQSPGRRMPDITLFGLRFSNRLVQEDPFQQELDPKCVAQLYGRDNSSSRLVSAFSGTNLFRQFYGYFIQVDQAAVLGGLLGVTLDDLYLDNMTWASPTVQAMNCLQLTFNRVRIRGGSQGISIVPSVATYYVNLEDCTLQGQDYALAASWSIIRANKINFSHVGRGAILTEACDLRLRQANVAFTSEYTDTIVSTFGGLYGGRHKIENLDIDMEGPSCRLAPFYMEKSNNVRSSLILSDIYLGSAANMKPLVISKGKPNEGNYFIQIEDIDDTNGKPSTQIQERLP